MCSPGWATVVRRQPERSGAPSQQCSLGWATGVTRQRAGIAEGGRKTGKGNHPKIAQIFADGKASEVALINLRHLRHLRIRKMPHGARRKNGNLRL